jgi:hypothetical protein
MRLHAGEAQRIVTEFAQKPGFGIVGHDIDS